MSSTETRPDAPLVETGGEAAEPVRKRPKPGERRTQILHALAGMLEQPGPARVTTAALAARLSVSEAALYRHFASKTQMFEGLIAFIEQTVFTLVNQILEREPDPRQQALRILALVLQFGQKNPGMARVMVGDALVHEDERLQQRINLLFDRIDATLRQCLRAAALQAGSATPTVEAQIHAGVLTAFVMGQLQRYARSGFKRLPCEQLEASLAALF